jgi:two-component system sensor histidine kinase KdpD
MGPLLDRPRPRLAVGVGILSTIVLALAVAPLHDDVTRAVPALLLVVPVIVAAVLGGRAPAFIIAAVAALAFTLALPPLGSPRIRLGEDAVALIVFSAVAFVASALVTTKMDTLHDVDEQRRALLRSVSHDLRTPLSVIHAVATDLRSGTTYDDATRDELLDIVIDETDRLDRFVANLLSMSRIEAGTLRPDMQPVDLGELVERVARRFERSGARRIALDVPADLPFVHGDHTQLEQVVSNLLDNAVRHTSPATRICVSARAAAPWVIMTVRDDGPGLPPAVREQLVASAPNISTGLGLTIVAAIVRLHGGTLTVADAGVGVGVGTSLTVSLPVAD